MSKILSYESFEILYESNNDISDDYDYLLELDDDEVARIIEEQYINDYEESKGSLNMARALAIGAVVGGAAASLVAAKLIKIKINLKKYRDALVKDALSEFEYKKKRDNPKLTKEKKAILLKGRKIEKEANAERIKLLNDRIDELATNNYLKNKASLGKNKAKLKAADILIKSSSPSIADIHKKRKEDLQKKIADKEKETKRIEKEAAAKEKEITQGMIKSAETNLKRA